MKKMVFLALFVSGLCLLYAQNAGELELRVTGRQFVSIYNDDTLCDIGSKSEGQHAKKISLKAGKYILDDDFTESNIEIKSGTVTVVTVSPRQAANPVQTKNNEPIRFSNKGEAPEWLQTYVAEGPERLGNLRQYRDKYYFVSERYAFHPVSDTYMKLLLWSQLEQKVSSEFSEITSSYTMDDSGYAQQRNVFTRTLPWCSITMEDDEEFSSRLIQFNRKEAEQLVNETLHFVIEDDYWIKREQSGTYTYYAIGTVPKILFNRYAAYLKADALQF
jgi:hypothetical protein